jgi:hypothetical protein
MLEREGQIAKETDVSIACPFKREVADTGNSANPSQQVVRLTNRSLQGCIVCFRDVLQEYVDEILNFLYGRLWTSSFALVCS